MDDVLGFFERRVIIKIVCYIVIFVILPIVWSILKFIFALFLSLFIKREDSAPINQEILLSKEEVDDLLNSLVQIPGQDYLISKFQVTQRLWECVMEYNPSSLKGKNYPVDTVTWNKCNAFVEKLNAVPQINEAGITFCLPSKEEWEYACRAESIGAYGVLANGNEGTLDEMGWYDENSNSELHEVGLKTPNAWGLYDMHGNVWEWTSTIQGDSAIIKGGGCVSKAEKCTINSDKTANIEKRYSNIGFRLCAKKNKPSDNATPIPEVDTLSQSKQESSLDVPLLKANDIVVVPEQLNQKDSIQINQDKRETTETEIKTIDSSVSTPELQEIERKLKVLSSLKDKGLITEEEYKALRKKTILKL